MSTEKDIKKLVINKMTKEQFEEITPSEDELYLVPDEPFAGTDGTNDGEAGLVPAPTADDDGKFLKSDGTWDEVNGGAEWGDITGDLADQTDLKNALDSKANQTTTYTKTEVDSALADKADVDDVYTQAEADAAISAAVSTETTARQTADNGLQSQIDAITAGSDVVDVVATKAALDAYDTSKLTDKDIIKVLADETHNNAISYYRWGTTAEAFTYVGSQGPFYTKAETDAALNLKQNALTAGDNITIENNVISAEGGVKVLTSADYNYPENNPDCIGLWLLEDGVYIVGEKNLRYKTIAGGNASTDAIYIAVSSNSITVNTKRVLVWYNLNEFSAGSNMGQCWEVKIDGSGTYASYSLNQYPVNDLTHQWINVPLSANQGRILKNTIDTRVPEPTSGDVDKFLKGDGTWSEVSGGAAWGDITGTLADQTDLKNALDEKPTIQVTNVDPGEGQPIAENTFIAVY